jgi:flagellar biosynthesis/type III secretory pathway protein FliH
VSLLINPTGEEVGAPAWRARELEHAPALRDPEVEALEARIATLEAALEDSAARAAEAIAAARAQGRKDAEASFTASEAERLQHLKEGVSRAARAISERLGGLDKLALAICETVLAPIFAEHDIHGAMASAIRRQLNALQRESVLCVLVSPLDFSDEAALHALQRDLGLDLQTQIACDEKLAQGECRIELRLGQIELSTPRYWQEVRAMLSALAEPDGLP